MTEAIELDYAAVPEDGFANDSEEPRTDTVRLEVDALRRLFAEEVLEDGWVIDLTAPHFGTIGVERRLVGGLWQLNLTYRGDDGGLRPDKRFGSQLRAAQEVFNLITSSIEAARLAADDGAER